MPLTLDTIDEGGCSFFFDRIRAFSGVVVGDMRANAQRN